MCMAHKWLRWGISICGLALQPFQNVLCSQGFPDIGIGYSQKCDWSYSIRPSQHLCRNVVSSIPMGPVFFYLCSCNCCCHSLRNAQETQIWEVFSHFHPCDGRLVTIDIRCGKQRSSGFCVQSFQFADGTTVCIVLGSGADILSCVHRFHSNTCHFVTLLELNERLLKENIDSQFSGITCCILLPHFIIFNAEMHPEKVGMIVNIHVDIRSHVFRMDTVYIKCIIFFSFSFIV